jgi:PKD repeat protein
VGEEDFARIQLGQFTANGLALNPSANGEFCFRGWDAGGVQGATSFNEMTGSLNTGKYYEFTVTPREGTAMTLQVPNGSNVAQPSLKFTVKRSQSGPRNFCVRSSVNNFSTNLPLGTLGANSPNLALLTSPNPVNTYFFSIDTAVTVTSPQVILPLSSYSNLTNPVTFRIYAYNAEDAVGTFSVDSLIIDGNYGVVENVQNFMDYSYCSHMFTNGQKDRMRLALYSQLSGRSNLWSETNRALTGTDENALVCAPVADFFPLKKFACVNDEIDFRDNSTNGVVDSYLWTFQDGVPATSTSSNPSVVFTSEGRKTVTLTVANAQGSNTKTINQCVVIAPTWSEVAGGPLFQDDFDSASDFQNYYVPLNHDQNISTWQQTNLAGFSNGTSMYLNAFDMAASNIDEGGYDIDEVVTPSCDLSMVSGASVSFKYAYASQSTTLANITDLFQVFISNNCGQTWFSTPRVSLQGLELVTAGSVSVPYYPSNSSEWREESFTVSSAYMNDGFRMKFVFKAGMFPNNLFIDDINMTGIVGVEELDADFFGAIIYPNPADESTVLSYVDRGAENLTITLTDLSGRVVETWTPRSAAPGPQRLTIDTNKLSTGAYLITMNSSTHSKTLKLLVD